MSQHQQDVLFHDHARGRWTERLIGDPDLPDCTIEQAWHEGFDCEIDRVDGTPRLHPETGMLLVHHPETSGDYDRIVRTAYAARDHEIKEHCDRCQGCNDFIKPGAYAQCCRACQSEMFGDDL